jgi:hypothetical protein
VSPARLARAPRRIGIAAAGVVVITLAASAGATVTGEPGGVGGANSPSNRPSLAAMPDTTLPEALDARTAPASVGAGERVDGLNVSGMEGFPRSGRFTVLSSTDRRCLVGGFLSPADGANPAQDGQASNTIVQRTVAAVRAERLVLDSDGKASLEIVDAWVDPATRGVQLAKQTSVALTKLASGPEGFVVYGLRRGDVLELVVPSPQRMSSLDPEGNILSSSCDHVRLELRAEVGAGTSVVVAGPIEVAQAAAAGQAIPQLSSPKPTRMIQVNASASRTSRDPAPVLSVAIRWAEDAPKEPRPRAASARQLDEE